MVAPMRIPLASQPSNRDSGGYSGPLKDAKLVNAYLTPDLDTGDMVVVKRPGIRSRGTPTTAGHGITNWNNVNYCVSGTALYKITDGTGLSPLTFTNVGAVSGVYGNVYQFTPCFLGTTPYLYFSSGFAAYTYTSGGAPTAVSGANFPSGGGSGKSAFLDNTLYVLGTDNYIYGSAYGDPTTWTDTTNKILCATAGDIAITIKTLGNYIIAFKYFSLDVYWDKGSPAGSPLALLKGAHSEVGIYSAPSLVKMGNALFWVGHTHEGGIQVYALIGLKVVRVSTPAVERLLWRLAFVTVVGHAVVIGGHRFYVIGPDPGVTPVSMGENNITLAYDIDLKKWYQWTWSDGNALPFYDSASTLHNHGDGTTTADTLFQAYSSGTIYSMDPTYYEDDDGLIPLDIVTPKVDGKSLFHKSNSRLDLVADQVSSGSTTVRWSDDDYQTWSKYVQLDMAQNVPSHRGLGQFTSRAFQVHHEQATQFRARFLDIYAEEGSS